jgi:hypothetical protein
MVTELERRAIWAGTVTRDGLEELLMDCLRRAGVLDVVSLMNNSVVSVQSQDNAVATTIKMAKEYSLGVAVVHCSRKISHYQRDVVKLRGSIGVVGTSVYDIPPCVWLSLPISVENQSGKDGLTIDI